MDRRVFPIGKKAIGMLAKRTRGPTVPWLSLLLLLSAAGCGGQSVSDLASSVKDAATQGVQSVKDTAQQVSQDVTGTAQNMTDKASQTLELAGTMKLTVDRSVEIPACYASFSRVDAAGAGVLELKSYRDAQGESSPSVLVHASCSANTLADLTGQTLAAQMFLQPEASGPLWTATTQPVSLKITAIDGKRIRAELAGGSLTHSATGASQAVTGSFEGVLP